jgi:hypothetical protein
VKYLPVVTAKPGLAAIGLKHQHRSLFFANHAAVLCRSPAIQKARIIVIVAPRGRGFYLLSITCSYVVMYHFHPGKQFE